MKYIILVLTIFLSVGCNKLANAHDPEKIIDLASQLKDIAAAVDGTLKFSAQQYVTSQALLLAAINNDETKLEPFKGYELKIEIQDNHAILLLCEHDVVLIEDAGCTAQSDVQHWQSTANKACEVTLNASQICSF
ncbi:hypothetical protein [Pseudoalteromonas tunicata]|uniref:hypothetical protein n=1 Tax=Pseudoalteromonas tunicata TaxID=314281 RepID=UPI00273E5A33|nr:hypothetical protein [Pseudoalteromonas tunicata]MDP4983256.1 hypothetical protein [Pseudoalteromonas tunicata]MDP5214497.1 hypothetical protein [Pseudoalteromonas tunicata]